MKISKTSLLELSESDEFIEENKFQKFRSRKRKFGVRKTIDELNPEDSEHNVSSDPHLSFLFEDRIIDELYCTVKSGKEATVYLAEGRGRKLAVKLYTDIRIRSFRRDEIYRQGRYIGSKRIEKAIQQGSEFGLNAHQILWVHEEFKQQKAMHAAGVPVPEPVALSGLAIVMEFIGDDDGTPAPRISDALLTKHEAEDAFLQSLEILRSVYSAGKVHGDFSAFNLLWHNRKAIVIDFPQMVEIESNPAYGELLRRDIGSLCKSFRKHGVKPDEESICREFDVKFLI